MKKRYWLFLCYKTWIFVLASLSPQSVGTQTLKALAVHFVGSPKGKFEENKISFAT